jgi:hypothetical protein
MLTYVTGLYSRILPKATFLSRFITCGAVASLQHAQVIQLIAFIKIAGKREEIIKRMKCVLKNFYYNLEHGQAYIKSYFYI